MNSPDKIRQLFREALSWGRTYGPGLTGRDWEESRDEMAQQFSSKLSEIASKEGDIWIRKN